MSKLFGSEVSRRFSGTLTEIFGLRAQLRPGERLAPLEGHLPIYYMSSLGEIIAAGSSEIQRNIIATRGLGLPRI